MTKKTSKKLAANASAKEIREFNKIKTVEQAKQFKKNNKPAPLAGKRKITKQKRKTNRAVVKQTRKAVKKKS